MSDSKKGEGTSTDNARDESDLAKMTREDLRVELKRRKLKIAGTKEELQRRLEAALALEGEREEDDGADKGVEDDGKRRC